MDLKVLAPLLPFYVSQIEQQPTPSYLESIFQRIPPNISSTKKQERDSKATWRRESWSTSQNECEGPEKDPDVDQTLHMLRSKLFNLLNNSNNFSNTKSCGDQPVFPPPPSPPDGTGKVNANRQVLLNLENALAWLIKTLYGASNSQDASWSYFKGLVTQLKELAWINDTEHSEIGEQKVGKFRFEALLPLRTPLKGISFKPKGTTSLNKTLCSLLSQITGPIDVQVKFPTKTFDGSSRGTRKPDTEELNYKREVSEILFKYSMSAAESYWADQSAEMQQQLCNHLVGALKLLFLYWGYYLCLKKRLLLSKDDRRELKFAYQEQLRQNTPACIEKPSTIRAKFPLYMVTVDLVDSSSDSRRESPSRPRTNSRAHDGYRNERRRSTSSSSTHTRNQGNMERECFYNTTDREPHNSNYSWGSSGTGNMHWKLKNQTQDQAGYYSGRYNRRFSTYSEHSSGQSSGVYMR